MTAPAGGQADKFPEKVTRNHGVLLGFVLGAVALLVVAPALLSDFRLSLLGRFICYGIVAVGIGLAWGRGGRRHRPDQGRRDCGVRARSAAGHV